MSEAGSAPSTLRDPSPEFDGLDDAPQAALTSLHRSNRRAFRSSYDANSARKDAVSTSLNALQASVTELSKAMKRPREDEEEDNGKSRRGADKRPAVGKHPHGHLIDVAFAHMTEKHRRAAMEGRLRPELLYTVIDPTHALYRHMSDKRALHLDLHLAPRGSLTVSMTVTTDELNQVEKFMQRIPDIQTFTFAWFSSPASCATASAPASAGVHAP